jgi:hypothetical protein
MSRFLLLDGKTHDSDWRSLNMRISFSKATHIVSGLSHF